MLAEGSHYCHRFWSDPRHYPRRGWDYEGQHRHGCSTNQEYKFSGMLSHRAACSSKSGGNGATTFPANTKTQNKQLLVPPASKVM